MTKSEGKMERESKRVRERERERKEKKLFQWSSKSSREFRWVIVCATFHLSRDIDLVQMISILFITQGNLPWETL